MFVNSWVINVPRARKEPSALTIDLPLCTSFAINSDAYDMCSHCVSENLHTCELTQIILRFRKVSFVEVVIGLGSDCWSCQTLSNKRVSYSSTLNSDSDGQTFPSRTAFDNDSIQL